MTFCGACSTCGAEILWAPLLLLLGSCSGHAVPDGMGGAPECQPAVSRCADNGAVLVTELRDPDTCERTGNRLRECSCVEQVMRPINYVLSPIRRLIREARADRKAADDERDKSRVVRLSDARRDDE